MTFNEYKSLVSMIPFLRTKVVSVTFLIRPTFPATLIILSGPYDTYTPNNILFLGFANIFPLFSLAFTTVRILAQTLHKSSLCLSSLRIFDCSSITSWEDSFPPMNCLWPLSKHSWAYLDESIVGSLSASLPSVPFLLPRLCYLISLDKY